MTDVTLSPKLVACVDAARQRSPNALRALADMLSESDGPTILAAMTRLTEPDPPPPANRTWGVQCAVNHRYDEVAGRHRIEHMWRQLLCGPVRELLADGRTHLLHVEAAQRLEPPDYPADRADTVHTLRLTDGRLILPERNR
jgi:hypothetical protein